MDDNAIIRLFNERNETALSELSKKHGTFLTGIAERILCNREDSQMCVNDAYLRAWESIPPAQPNILRAFVGKIVKCIAVSMLRKGDTEKRGGGEFTLVLDELEGCISDGSRIETDFENKQLIEEINNFLFSRSEFDQRAFVLRYWYCESVRDIAAQLGAAENRVSVSLYRTRLRLKEHLAKEGYTL